MSRGRAHRMAGALIGCIFVMAAQAVGSELDAWAAKDAECAKYGKTYSHVWRACKPKD